MKIDVLTPEEVAYRRANPDLFEGYEHVLCDSHEALRKRAEYLIGALTEIRLNMNGDRFVEAGKRQMYLRVIDAALAGVGDV